MRKTLLWCSALMLGITIVFSCSIAGKMPDENARSGVDKLESLQNAFKCELKEAIARMSDKAEPLLSSVLFMDGDEVSDVVKSGGLTTSIDGFVDDDAVFATLNEDEQHQIEILARKYFDDVQNLAKSITVFDKGLPEGVIETDEYVEYDGIQYSKCVKDTLEIAYQIRDSLYNPNDDFVQGAKIWAVPRWHLIGAPLGAIYYSYKSNFTNEEKEAIRYAMDEWEKATDGTVRFYEKNLDWWGKIKWGFGIVRNVRIIKDHYGEDNADAWSIQGSLPWGRIWINIDRVFRKEEKNIYIGGWKSEWSDTHSTLIHELGHTIGLCHEFARSDRDEYIELGNISPDPGKFLRFWEKTLINNYGTYDYLSCMNYSGFYKVKGTNRWIDFADVRNISHNDVLTVKYIYSRISYQEMLNNWQDTKSIVLEDWL